MQNGTSLFYCWHIAILYSPSWYGTIFATVENVCVVKPSIKKSALTGHQLFFKWSIFFIVGPPLIESLHCCVTQWLVMMDRVKTQQINHLFNYSSPFRHKSHTEHTFLFPNCVAIAIANWRRVEQNCTRLGTFVCIHCTNSWIWCWLTVATAGCSAPGPHLNPTSLTQSTVISE